MGFLKAGRAICLETVPRRAILSLPTFTMTVFLRLPARRRDRRYEYHHNCQFKLLMLYLGASLCGRVR